MIVVTPKSYILIDINEFPEDQHKEIMLWVGDQLDVGEFPREFTACVDDQAQDTEGDTPCTLEEPCSDTLVDDSLYVDQCQIQVTKDNTTHLSEEPWFNTFRDILGSSLYIDWMADDEDVYIGVSHESL